jgi:tRNA(fMet)-specific endonuclease VapC
VSAVLIDTDVFSYVLKRDPAAAAYERHLTGKQQTLCFAVVAELLQGAIKRDWGHARIARLEQSISTLTVIPYDIGVVRAWAALANLKTETGSDRTMGCMDRWIAACAIHHGIPLVTNNRGDFEGIPGLLVISEAA